MIVYSTVGGGRAGHGSEQIGAAEAAVCRTAGQKTAATVAHIDFVTRIVSILSVC